MGNKMIETGRRIQERRKIKGLTQKQLAEMIGRSESSISEYEKGKVEIPGNIIDRIADELGVHSAYLHGWTVDIEGEEPIKGLQEYIEKEAQKPENMVHGLVATMNDDGKKTAVDVILALSLLSKFQPNFSDIEKED